MRLIQRVDNADAGKVAAFRKKVNIQLLSLGARLGRSLSGRENAIFFNRMLFSKSRKYMLCWIG